MKPWLCALLAIGLLWLILPAQASGSGVITINPGAGTSPGNPATVDITIAPPGAFQAGGAWKVSTQPNSDYSKVNPSALEVTNTNSLQLVYTNLSGWNLPTNQTVSVSAGSVAKLTNYYTLAVAWATPAAITYGTALNSIQLNATAITSGTFAYNPTNGTVLNTGINTLSVTFTPGNTTTYGNATTTSVSLVVLPASLTVTATDAVRAYGQTNPIFTGTIAGLTNNDNITATYSCSATSSSPLGTNAITPTLVDPTNRRTNYTVNLVNGTLTITQGVPVLTWSNPVPTINYGTALGANQLNATANVPGTFAYIPTLGTMLNPGINILTVNFTPSDTVDYTGATDIVALVVAPTNVPAIGQSSSAASFIFTTIAGQASSGSTDGAGSDALFNNLTGVAVDNNGNVYVADFGNDTIRKLTPAGEVTTIAGFPETPGSADGTNELARFNHPSSLVVDSLGNIYVADAGNNTIRKITPAGSNWVVTTIAGTAGVAGTNDGTGTNAQFSLQCGFFDATEIAFLSSIAADGAGNLYVTCGGSSFTPTSTYYATSLRKIALNGTNCVVTTIASDSEILPAYSNTDLNPFSAVAVDKSGNVFVVVNYEPNGAGSTIEELTPMGGTWMVTTIAGSTSSAGDNNGMGTNGQFANSIPGMTVDGADNLYVTDGNVIRKIAPAGSSWEVTTFAGDTNASGTADATGTNAEFYSPGGLAVDGTGNVYVADSGNNTIRRVTPLGLVYTLAGRSVSAGSANGLGSAAQFNGPNFIAQDASGNLYVSDSGNDTIRQISPSGQVNTLAGKAGDVGFSDGVGSDALFNGPDGMTMDSVGNLFVVDAGNGAIRQITPEGLVTTIAGGTPSFINGNYQYPKDGIGTNASFFLPGGITMDATGHLYVADATAIRMMTQVGSNWAVSTIAGSSAGYAGLNDGIGTNAQFSFPEGITADASGNLFVADADACTIREATPVGTNWLVTTIAGNSMDAGPNFEVDGIGTNAVLDYPWALAADSAGNIYVTDYYGDTIRKVSPVGGNWVVTTIGGLALEAGSADGLGNNARFFESEGILSDQAGNLYVVDSGNNTIREGVFSQYAPAYPVPLTQPANNATVVVTLLPPEANGQWRFPWELAWRASGSAVTNLVPNQNYPIEFSPVPGYLTLAALTTNFVAAGQPNFVTGQYYPTITSVDTNSGGSLQVFFQVNPPSGAGWKLLGTSGAFLPSGFTTNLLPGGYLIEFAALTNFVQLPVLSVEISAGSPAVVEEIYQPSQAAPAGFLLPVPVPSGEITNLANYPYGFNGQLETDVGYGSGVAVETNVVLTAAHLIFNDQTLSYVSQAWWYPQEEAPQFVPEPQAAQGWLVLSGYASQRTNDLKSGLYTPDESSPQSRNFDVAALYFSSPVAGGGYGGYLPSDDTPNSWLAGTAEKMLVGYPVDGSMFQASSVVPGQMYEIGPQPYPLSLDTEPVNDQQVYTAAWFLSYPGNSGGPFYVQLNGYYCPAGVYLGTLFSGSVPYASAVRAIDSNVVNLITNAQALLTTGTNNSGGGVIAVVPGAGIANNPAIVEVTIAPPAAFLAGGAWKFSTLANADYSTQNPSALAVSSSTSLQLDFMNIDGWNLPTNQSLTVAAGSITTFTATYSLALSWPVPAAITYGIALGSGQLDATAVVNGTYAYNPTFGAVLNAGPQTLSVTFTPNNTTEDGGAGATNVSFVVSPAPLTVTVSNASRPYGATNPVFTGAITGLQNGDNITATYSTSAATNSTVGTYAITPSLSDPANRLGNYTIMTNLGTLSVFAPPVIQAAQQSGNSFTFSWSAISNQVYQIQFATNLTQTNWTTLTNTITATNSTASVSEAISNNAQKFYRVLLLP